MKEQLSEALVAQWANRWWRLENLYWVQDEHGNVRKFRSGRHSGTVFKHDYETRFEFFGHLGRERLAISRRQANLRTINRLGHEGLRSSQYTSAAMVIDISDGGDPTESP